MAHFSSKLENSQKLIQETPIFNYLIMFERIQKLTIFLNIILKKAKQLKTVKLKNISDKSSHLIVFLFIFSFCQL